MEGAHFEVRDGELANAGSWIYAWVAVGDDPAVLHVGATALHPATRTWLHLNDPDPNVGRIAARVPEATTEPFDVLVEPVPEGVARGDARDAAISRLSELGLLSARYVGFDPVPAARRDETAERLVARLVDALKR
jgi:hypothetical protein